MNADIKTSITRRRPLSIVMNKRMNSSQVKIGPVAAVVAKW